MTNIDDSPFNPTSGSPTQRSAEGFAAEPAETRDDLYRHMFTGRMTPLSEIEEPASCRDIPDLRDEILSAYLRYTNFEVGIWCNYDTAARLFFTDATRLNDTGKLVLPPRQHSRLARIDWGDSGLFKICFLLGTAFKPLCHIQLAVGWTTSRPGMVLHSRIFPVSPEVENEHPDFFGFIEHVCVDIARIRCRSNGLTMMELNDLAAWFRAEPDGDGYFHFGPRSYSGDWLNGNATYRPHRARRTR